MTPTLILDINSRKSMGRKDLTVCREAIPVMIKVQIINTFRGV